MNPNKFNAKKLLYIENDVYESLNSDISKILIADAYSKYSNNKLSQTGLFFAIKRQIIQGSSSFSSMEDLLAFFEQKEYYKINNGDTNENKIYNSYSR